MRTTLALALRRAALMLALALAGVALTPPAARADTHSASYSIWTVNGTRVLVRLLVPVAQARSLTGTDLPVLTSAKLAQYLLQHVGVQAAGRECDALDQGFDIGRVNPLNVGPGLYGYEILFNCASVRDRVLRNDALFARLPGHVDFARVQIDNQFSEQLFTASRTTLRVPDAGPMPRAGTGQYLRLGVAHVLHSADRLCVLLGMLLLLRRRRALIGVIAGFAFGYGWSALLAGAGWLVPRTALVEAFIGFLVLVPAVRLLAPPITWRSAAVAGGVLLLPLVLTGYLWGGAPVLLLAGAALLLGGGVALPAQPDSDVTVAVVLAGLLGALDGCVLPAELLPLALPARSLLPIALGFDAGAVLVDSLLLLAALALGLVLRKRWAAIPRPLFEDVASTALGGLGVFWLLSRLYN